MSTYSSPFSYDNFNMKRLGFFLDGWADIIEGAGDKAEKVREDVKAQLHGREMPDIKLGIKKGAVGSMYSSVRNYVSTETYPGAITMIYITEHGKDLYTSWRTFIRPVLNTTLLWIMGGIALLFGLISSASSYRDSGGAFFGGLFGTFIVMALLVAFAGNAIKADPLAFFLIEPSYFDADDITAMSLSVHYSVLRALDKVGIDSSKLRLKHEFKGGRKNVAI